MTEAVVTAATLTYTAAFLAWMHRARLGPMLCRHGWHSMAHVSWTNPAMRYGTLRTQCRRCPHSRSDFKPKPKMWRQHPHAS